MQITRESEDAAGKALACIQKLRHYLRQGGLEPEYQEPAKELLKEKVRLLKNYGPNTRKVVVWYAGVLQ